MAEQRFEAKSKFRMALDPAKISRSDQQHRCLLLKLGRPEDDISIYFDSQDPKSSISFVPGSTTSEWGAQIARAAGHLPPSPRQASDSRFLESNNDETELEEYSSKHSVDRGIEAIV